MEWPLEEAVPLKAAPGAFPIDSRYVAPLLITLILVIGQFSYGILESYPRTLLAIGCSIVTEIVLSYLVYRKFPQQWILAAVLGSIFRGSSGMCPAADGYGPSSPLWGEGFRTTAFCLEGTSLRGRNLHKQIENYTVLPQQTRLVRLNRRDNHNSRNLFCERRHQTLPESAAGPHGPVRCPAPAWPGSRLAGLPVRGREQGPARRPHALMATGALRRVHPREIVLRPSRLLPRRAHWHGLYTPLCARREPRRHGFGARSAWQRRGVLEKGWPKRRDRWS